MSLVLIVYMSQVFGESIPIQRVSTAGITDGRLLLTIDNQRLITGNSRAIREWILNILLGKDDSVPFPGLQKVWRSPTFNCYIIQIGDELIVAVIRNNPGQHPSGLSKESKRCYVR